MSDAAHAKEVVIKGVSSLDEPSVKWGWHGYAKKAGAIIGGAFAVFLLLMLIGNHTGNVENLYLIGFAILIFVGIALSMRKKVPYDDPKRFKVYEVPEGHYTTTKY